MNGKANSTIIVFFCTFYFFDFHYLVFQYFFCYIYHMKAYHADRFIEKGENYENLQNQKL